MVCSVNVFIGVADVTATCECPEDVEKAEGDTEYGTLVLKDV